MLNRKLFMAGTVCASALVTARVEAVSALDGSCRLVFDNGVGCFAAQSPKLSHRHGRDRDPSTTPFDRVSQSWTSSTGYVENPPASKSDGKTADSADVSSESTNASDPASPPTASEIEITFWNSVKDSNDPALFEAYLDRFPNGEFAVLARAKIRALKDSKSEQPADSKSSTAADTSAPSDLPKGATLTHRVKLGAFPSSLGAQAKSSIDGEPRGWLGVRIQDVDSHLKQALGLSTSDGSLITELTDNSPASRSDLLPGDIVLSVDKRKVQSSKDLARIIASYRDGDEVKIEVWRMGNGSEDMGRYLRQRADSGDNVAAFVLSKFAMSGHVVAKDEALGGRLMRKAAESGLTEAMQPWGNMLLYGRGTAKNESEAANWFRKSAEAGDVAAMNDMAALYEWGTGVTKNESEAMSWARKAADKGNASAMSRLGRFYHFGKGTTKDTTVAARWYRKAADAGHSIAMNNLASLLDAGDGVPKDSAEALRLYQRAAERGYTTAMGNMAMKYDKGEGVAKDPDEAARLVYEAIQRGDDTVLKNVTEYSSYWTVDFLKSLQRRLKSAGLYSSSIDGKFGPNFKRAVESLARQPRAAVE